MNKLSQDIHFSSLLKFAFPSIIMMIMMSLYTMIDGMFVANFVNSNAFSAVNIVLPLTNVVIAVGTMLGSGICAIIAKKLGENKRQEANENVSFIVAFSVLLGIVFTIICVVFAKPLVYMLGANDTIFQYCMDYAIPLCLFIPFSLLQLMYQNLFVANGKPNIGLLVTILGGVANVVLDYVFIAVWGMGIKGAAIATGIGFMIPAIFGTIYFFKHKEANFHFVKPKIDWYVLKKTLGNGLSEMVSNLSGSITTYLFNILMMHYVGPDGVAAIAIILYLDFLLIAISLGYSLGVAPVISYNYGAKETVKLKKIFRISVVFYCVMGVVMFLLTFFNASFLVSFFAKDGSTVYTLALFGLQIYSFSYLMKGFSIFTSGLFTALSNGKVSAFLSFMRSLVFIVVFLLGLSYFFGMNGIFFAPVLAELCAIVVTVIILILFQKEYQY